MKTHSKNKFSEPKTQWKFQVANQIYFQQNKMRHFPVIFKIQTGKKI